MRLWRRRPAAVPDVEAAAPEARADPEPLAVFQIEGIVEGWVPWQERRVSDGLNAGEPLRVQTANPDGTPGTWVELDLDDVIAVAPSPRSTPSPGRLARRQHAVEVRAGPYVVNGIAHMPPGADPGRYARSTSRRWLPLTQCTVASGDEKWAVEVVIVNLAHALRD